MKTNGITVVAVAALIALAFGSEAMAMGGSKGTMRSGMTTSGTMTGPMTGTMSGTMTGTMSGPRSGNMPRR